MLYDIFLDISQQVIFHSSIYCSLFHWLGWRGTQVVAGLFVAWSFIVVGAHFIQWTVGGSLH